MEDLTNAYTQYLEKEFGKEFYNDIWSLVKAKDVAEFYVGEALSDDIIDAYDINSLDEFVEIMSQVYTSEYLSIDAFKEIWE